MKKRFLALLLVLVMMVSLLPAGMALSAYADSEDEIANKITTKKLVGPEKASDEEEDAELQEAEDEEEAQASDEDEAEAELEKDDAEAKAKEKKKTPQEYNFDPALAGAWECYYDSYPQKSGEAVAFFLEMGNLRGFMYNGAMNSYRINYPNFIAKSGEAIILSAEKGKLDYFDKLCEFTEEYKELFTDEYSIEAIDGLDKCSNVEISYELFDITKKGDGDFKPDKDKKKYYDASKEDGLLIKIEADVKVNPTTVNHQVYEFKFYKDYDRSWKMNNWCMLGEWEDSAGNSWSAAPYLEKEGTTYEDERCIYTLLDSDGVEHITENFYWTKEEDGKFDPNGYLQFYFPTFSGPQYKIESINYNEIKLVSESGSLTLTRTAEPFATAGESIPEA